jgi:Uma2 family endonuclease
MPIMSSQTSTAEIVEAIEHLPAGAQLVIHEISWDDYECLLDELGDDSHARVCYDSGRLEILSPTSGPHGKYEWFINVLVTAFCETRRLKLLGLGHATWNKKSVRKGIEADACFYVATPATGRTDFSLEAGPPPDICVEIDITRDSLKKLSIYAALGIPEVWIYDETTFRFYSLIDGKYSVIEESKFLSGLTSAMLVDAMEASKEGEPMEAVEAFRQRV